MKSIDINLKETRSTVINWPNQIRQIVDGYRSYHTITHGIQKDAIQNSWDARLDKKNALNWSVLFELIETKDKTLICFTDFGTTGLTGRILKPEELELDLPLEERWGRFENVAFTKDPSEKSLGARGRGKFIFLGASEHKALTEDKKVIGSLLLYDTLTPDGNYRFGFRTITTTESRIHDDDNDAGVKRLKNFTNGLLDKLSKVGTRVIIVDPKKEVVDAFKNGDLENYIRETWWEIIQTYKTEINIKINNDIKRVNLNDHFHFPEKDSERFKVWLKTNVKLPGAPTYLIKKLHIVYDATGITNEDLRGVFIQRGGMKVCSLKVNYLEKSIADSVYGYITLDEKLESKIKEDEGIEHYSFDFKKLIPKYVKQFIEDECERFLREKLNIENGKKTKNYEKDRSAEKKAIYQINKIAAQLGLIGKGIFTPRERTPSERIERPIRLKFGQFSFPDVSTRVNYGQNINNIKLEVENNTELAHNIGVRFSIQYDEGEEIKIFIDNQFLKIDRKSNKNVIDNFEMKITEEEFKYKGKYTFFARLVSLEDDHKGEILHQLSRHFWVEENPPQKGIFEDIEAIEFPKEKETIMGESYKGGGMGYIFQYNSLHPAKKVVENDEDMLMKYLIELMSLELAWIDLRNKDSDSKIFSNEDKENPDRLVRTLTKFLGQIKHKIN